MDVYQIVTDKIVGMLEAGVVPWRRPWSSADCRAISLPKNLTGASTIFCYRRVNTYRRFG